MQDRVRWLDDSERFEIDRDAPVDVDQQALGERPVADGAADAKGFADAGLERRLPEVALEWAERGRERLGDGSGSEQVAALGGSAAAVMGRLWSSRRWPSGSISHSMSCGAP